MTTRGASASAGAAFVLAFAAFQCGHDIGYRKGAVVREVAVEWGRSEGRGDMVAWALEHGKDGEPVDLPPDRTYVLPGRTIKMHGPLQLHGNTRLNGNGSIFMAPPDGPAIRVGDGDPAPK